MTQDPLNAWFGHWVWVPVSLLGVFVIGYMVAWIIYKMQDHD